MSTATEVARPASSKTNRIYIASFLELMHLRSDCTPPGDGRSGARFFRSWPLAVSIPSHPDQRPFGTALYDTSDTGIAFLSEHPIEPGTIVRIKLFWYDENAPFVPAVVRHVTPHRDSIVIGCEYVMDDTRAPSCERAAGTHKTALA